MGALVLHERTRQEVTASEASEPPQGTKLFAAVVALTLVGVAAVGTGSMDSAADVPAPDPSHSQSPEPRRLSHHTKPRRLSPQARPQLDRTGRKRVGKASFYAAMFAGRTMADGTTMRPTSNNAASRTLPLGTTAKVTNLETGKTAVVAIHDRGPYVAGRIVDLSPATAREIGLDRRTGVTWVEVAPIAIPMPNGDIKLGDGISGF
ncbi:MAG: septal ring lytic transglycosylase RlpA family protein [Steroidobacteraceae bacterium]